MYKALSFTQHNIFVYNSLINTVVIYYASDKPGTQLIVYPSASSTQWNTLWSYNGSTMELYVVSQGKQLNLTTTSDITVVDNDSTLDQRRVWIDEQDSTKNQQWIMDLSTNTIVNYWNGMYLSVYQQNQFNLSGLKTSSFLVKDYNNGNGGFTRFNW